MPRLFGWPITWMIVVSFLAAQWFIFQTINYVYHMPVPDIFLKFRSQERLISPGYEDLRFPFYSPLRIPKSSYERQIRMLHRHKSDWQTGAPPTEYEKTRRRLMMVTRELWFFMESQFKNLREMLSDNQTAEKIDHILEESIEYKRSMWQEVDKLSKVDGYNSWRFREAVVLSESIQKRLISLQNPSNCEEARKLICHIHKNCGFGCQFHHLVYCLITAYSSRRTMILRSSGWRYDQEGWESVFLPVSDTCIVGDAKPWHEEDNDQATNPQGANLVVDLPFVEFQTHPYVPRAVPKDFVDRITRLHEVPALWWVSQFVKYLMRLQPETKRMIENAALNLKFKLPIVGVQIRRTDKLFYEATSHPVEEYMLHVEEYYKQLSTVQLVDEKRIYLASDDASVFEEIKTKYPDYEVVGSVNISISAAKEFRYSSESLNGLLVDLHLLAYSDLLVCTFSSQVCRLAYEMMQYLHPDAANRFRSLDDIYYFGGGGMHRVVAVMDHRANSNCQMNLTVGDHVKIDGNLWNGYSVGRNLRTKQVGEFPSFKVDEVVEALDFPLNFSQGARKFSSQLSPSKSRFPRYESNLYIFIIFLFFHVANLMERT